MTYLYERSLDVRVETDLIAAGTSGVALGALARRYDVTELSIENAMRELAERGKAVQRGPAWYQPGYEPGSQDRKE